MHNANDVARRESPLPIFSKINVFIQFNTAPLYVELNWPLVDARWTTHVLTRQNNVNDGIYYRRIIPSAKSILHSDSKRFPNSWTCWFFFFITDLYSISVTQIGRKASAFIVIRREELSPSFSMWKKRAAILVETSIEENVSTTCTHVNFFLFFLRFSSRERNVRFLRNSVRLFIFTIRSRSAGKWKVIFLYFLIRHVDSLMLVINFLSEKICAS